MLKVEELREFLRTLPDDCKVWIGAGGLTLHDEQGGYIEVGGDPDDGLLDDPGEILKTCPDCKVTLTTCCTSDHSHDLFCPKCGKEYQ
jgi:hypothetical protein